jgi:hypothetical protein
LIVVDNLLEPNTQEDIYRWLSFKAALLAVQVLRAVKRLALFS